MPVVLWDAPALFARSPLAEVWQHLHLHRAKGVAEGSVSRAATTSDLLDLAARLQLLWRYGGVSVDMQSSADQVLKVGDTPRTASSILGYSIPLGVAWCETLYSPLQRLFTQPCSFREITVFFRQALSAFNRTDSSHVYLETTRGALVAAPQTCNAVVFDLISAITKTTKTKRPASAQVGSSSQAVAPADGWIGHPTGTRTQRAASREAPPPPPRRSH